MQDFIVPVVTYPDAPDPAEVAATVGVAQRFGAGVVLLVLAPDIRPPSSPLAGLVLDVPGMIRQAEGLAREKGDAIAAAVSAAAHATGTDLRAQRRAVPPELFGDKIAEAARYADLVLMPLPVDNAGARDAAEAAVFGSGRPVMILPRQEARDPTGCVVVAWDGSRAAARALGDAIPFLSAARDVVVLTVDDDVPARNAELADILATHLRHRDLPARAEVVQTRGRTIGQTLQEEAILLGADMLVMGAYGHSRLREFVLGGATRGVLDGLRLPVLLAH